MLRSRRSLFDSRAMTGWYTRRNWRLSSGLVQVALEFEAVEGCSAHRRLVEGPLRLARSSWPCTWRCRRRPSSTRRYRRRRRGRCRCWPTARPVANRRVNGLVSDWRTRPASVSASSSARGSPRSGSRTRRHPGATRCRLVRTTLRSRAATSRSTWSPASWPRVSLIILNPSRSRYTTATSSPVRAVRRDGVFEAVVEQGTVGEPGERVVKRVVAQFLLGPLSIRDVS